MSKLQLPDGRHQEDGDDHLVVVPRAVSVPVGRPVELQLVQNAFALSKSRASVSSGMAQTASSRERKTGSVIAYTSENAASNSPFVIFF